ncbi:MAG TPA: serine hydrolase [Gammaproteobacteria bacterium]|nr:serine hydrolase [Gammaproteobacteria bacterium]
MQIMTKMLTIFLCSFFAVAAYATTTTESSITPMTATEADHTPFIEQTMKQIMEQHGVPGIAVLLYIKGKPTTYYFGYANETKQTPVTRQTIFEIGSISKVMTSVLLAQQVDFAKVQLNDSITDYLVDLPETYEDITPKNLATHTGGFPFNVPSDIKNQKALQAYLQTWQLPYPADAQWIYSNASIGLIGEVLAVATKRKIEDLYQRRLLMPIGMQPIAWTVPPALQRFYAQGHDKEGRPVPASSMGIFPCAGDVKASATDMQRFLAAAIGLPGTPKQILYPMRMTQTAYVKVPAFLQGLGWQLYPLPQQSSGKIPTFPIVNLRIMQPVEEMIERPVFDGNMLMEKTGGTEGFRSYIAVIPNQQAGIVVLMNQFVDTEVIVGASRQILLTLAASS